MTTTVCNLQDHQQEHKRGLSPPSALYPLFENASRISHSRDHLAVARAALTPRDVSGFPLMNLSFDEGATTNASRTCRLYHLIMRSMQTKSAEKERLRLCEHLVLCGPKSCPLPSAEEGLVETRFMTPHRAISKGIPTSYLFSLPHESEQGSGAALLLNNKSIRNYVVQKRRSGYPKPYLGFRLENQVVTEVALHGPAHMAGLAPGDRIFRCNDAAVRSSGELRDGLAKVKVGQHVILGVVREGKAIVLSLRVLDHRYK